MGRTIRIIHVQRPEPVLPAVSSRPEPADEEAPPVRAATAPTVPAA